MVDKKRLLKLSNDIDNLIETFNNFDDSSDVVLKNLTPHDIHIYDTSGKHCVYVVTAQGNPARCEEIQEDLSKLKLEKIQLSLKCISYGEVTNLPDPQENTFYIVSTLVAQNAINRKDLLVPVDIVRDENGKILGAKSLAFYKNLN